MAPAPALTPGPETLRLTGARRKAFGVLRGIDRARLVEIARLHECVLELVLLRIGDRPRAAGCFVGADSTVRLVTHPPSWDELLDLAFLEIAVDGASSPQVARRLVAVHEALASAAPPDLRPGIEERAATLVGLIDATTVEAVRPAARRPDPLGLG